MNRLPGHSPATATAQNAHQHTVTFRNITQLQHTQSPSQPPHLNGDNLVLKTALACCGAGQAVGPGGVPILIRAGDAMDPGGVLAADPHRDVKVWVV